MAKNGAQSFMDWFKAPQTDEKSEKEGTKTNDELLKQIESLSKRLDDADRRLSEAHTTVAQPASVAPDAPEPPALDLSGLPDPFLEPEKYSKEYSKRNQDFVRATMAFEKAQEQAQRGFDAQFTSQADALWETFQSEYPDYAKNAKAVRFATAEVVSRAASQGKDVQAYMFGNRTAFMKEVAKEIETLGVKPEAPKTEEPADRTDGLFGGSSGGTKSAEAPVTDMVKDLRDIQTKLQLY